MVSHKTSKKPKEFVLILSSDLSQVTKVEPFLVKVNRALRLDEVQFNQLFLATSEAVTNSIIHGNKRNSNKKVIITCEIDSGNVIVRVHDEGKGFNEHRLHNPLAKEHLMNEGGRGIFLMRTLMDNVRWKKRGGTEVIMKLKIKKPVSSRRRVVRHG